MVDPIIDEELKRKRIIDKSLEYQEYLDQLDNEKINQEGNLQGKKVVAFESQKSTLSELFKSKSAPPAA